jgi:signal transduction histidine kinase
MSLLFTLLQLADLCALLVCATIILARDPEDRGNRAAAILLYTGAGWSSLQLLWSITDSPELAIRLIRLSSVGWAFMPPLVSHFILEVTRSPAPMLRRALPYLFAWSVAIVILDNTTPWVCSRVFLMPWGWAYASGPIAPLSLHVTMGALVCALVVAARAYRQSKLETERSQGLAIATGIFPLLLVGGLTDAVFPWLGHPMVQLSTTTYAIMGVMLAWSLSRFGYSILSPGTFASEITATLSEGLALLRLDDHIRSANEGLARILGRPLDQLESLRIDQILSLPLLDPPREVAEVRAWLFGPSSERIPVSVSARMLRDSRGLETGLAVVVRDLREIEALQRRLVLSGRMMAVGQLAAGVAHEVNNPTAYVRSNILLLREYWSNAAELFQGRADTQEKGGVFADGTELIDESLEGIERIASIVQQIGRFTHADDGRREMAELEPLLESALRMARPRLRSGVTVERYAEPVPALECAPRELEQVFLNLLLNAADAIGDSGTIRIATLVGEDGRAHIDVADDGTGIEPEHLARVFDPFFSTKPVGEGTGLGLAICYEIVERHGGEIEVSSELGRGTVFSVRLPLVRT